MTPQTTGELAGRVAIITGGASGIGRETALAMAAAGAAVAVADLNDDGAAAVAGQIADGGGVAMSVAVDVADEARVAAMVAAVTERLGRRVDTGQRRGGDRPGSPGGRWSGG